MSQIMYGSVGALIEQSIRATRPISAPTLILKLDEALGPGPGMIAQSIRRTVAAV